MRRPQPRYGRTTNEGGGGGREGVVGWFAGRLPDAWGTPEIAVDRDEITVVLPIEPPTTEGTEADVAAAEAGRLSRWREETRDERIQIAREAEHRYGRKVAWGATTGGSRQLFTHLAVPVMTRLRQPERQVLDTLVDSGVARSRAEALAWSVKLVGQHADTWLAELRQALAGVEKVREQGPAR
jgi:hypothetical protein